MIARAGMIAVLLVAGAGAAWGQDRPPVLHTGEAFVDETLAKNSLAMGDPLAVFAYVLGQLPARVQVYPTENYYYFRFTRDGVPYAGNIRFAAADRDQGKVNFSYNERPTDWNPEPKGTHEVFGAEQGVAVVKLAPLLYRVTLGAKSVEFGLNDLSKLEPPPGFLRPDEKYLGPSFDESGVRFFFVFNARLRVFHFLLDGTAPAADAFVPLKKSEPILIGKRTGFAFYQFEGRKILIGANRRQSRLNTYYDGPFDQLPENFIEGDALRDAIVSSDPSVKGRIDRLGNFSDGSGRFLIHPYMLYGEPAELAVFHRCATSRAVPPSDRPRCFVIDDDEAERRHPRPLALKRR